MSVPPWVLPKAPYTPFMHPRTAGPPGLSPLDMQDWLVRLPDFEAQMARRREVMAGHAEAVLGATHEAEPAEWELLDLLNTALGDGPRELTYLEKYCPLTAMGRLVPEDFCILLPDAASGEYRLVAAVLCFPARWLLHEKLGRPLTIIHDPVPEYGDDLARRVNRVFETLRVERPLVRVNWTIHPTPELFLPLGLSDKLMMEPDPGQPLYLRTERQTLIRLPRTGAVVFGIKTSVSPLDTLNAEEARTLLDLVEHKSEAEIAYRGRPSLHLRSREILSAIVEAGAVSAPGC